MKVSGLLWQQTNFFTRKPLNYETFTNRINSLHKLSITPEILSDCVVAARVLEQQRIVQQKDAALRLSSMALSSSHSDFLNIRRSYTTLDLEEKVVSLMRQHRDMVARNDSVVRTYLLTEPTPTNPNEIIQFIQSSVLHTMGTGGYTKKIGLVKIGLRTLLNQKDYHNAFKLLDVTISSPGYVRLQRRAIHQKFLGYISVSCLVGGLIMWEYLVFLGVMYFVSSVGLKLGFLNLKSMNHHLARVGWRPHCGLIDKQCRNNELYMVNKIITHYEEHSEVNVKNFHHSKVRTIMDLNMFDRNDYILEVPDLVVGDTEVLSPIEVAFRDQLKKRKMVLHDLQEELMFLDFWLVQGEDYEWVEPDQDPAEIIKLKTQK